MRGLTGAGGAGGRLGATGATGADRAGGRRAATGADGGRLAATGATGADAAGPRGAMIEAAELESASAIDVLAWALARFHPRLVLACSFQKEESVLFHMLSELAGGGVAAETPPRAFTIDTGVLFPETLETWRRFEERFPVAIEVYDASSPGEPWSAQRCCGEAKVAALEAALDGVDAWITGIRREQAPTRAGARKVDRDERRGIVKINPLADWSERDVWRYVMEHELPYNPLHDRGYASIGCAPCTAPGEGREGRWAGQDKTECGLHV